MSDQKPPVKKLTPEEREAEEERVMDKLAAKVAKKLTESKQVQLPYSVCPGCGYLFKTKEEEDKYNECPRCEYRGPATRLKWDSTEDKKT